MNYFLGLTLYLLISNNILSLNAEESLIKKRYDDGDKGDNGEDEYEEVYVAPVQVPDTIIKNKKTALSAACSSHNPSNHEINENSKKHNVNKISIKNTNIHNSDQKSNSLSSIVRPPPFGLFGAPGPFMNPYPYPVSNGVFRNSIRNRLHLFKREYEPKRSFDSKHNYKREITGVLNMLNTLVRSSYNQDKSGKTNLRAIKIRRRQ